MELSAEVRWFWSAEQPDIEARLRRWFEQIGRFPPGGGRQREDFYLVEPDFGKLGLKERGGKPGVEVKALAGERGTLWGATVELWSKWTAMVPSMLWRQQSCAARHERRWNHRRRRCRRHLHGSLPTRLFARLLSHGKGPIEAGR